VAVKALPAKFGKSLRAYRLDARLTQRELAERAGVGVRTVRDIELGMVRTPQHGSVRRLVRALGLVRDDGQRLLYLAGIDTDDTAPRMSVNVLGTLLVRCGEVVVDVPTERSRSVLALLAVYAGQVAPAAEIVDTLWGESPPPSCRRLVQVYVRQLRDVLEPYRPWAPDRILVAAHGGYRLNLTDHELDSARFDVLTARARQAWVADDTALAMELFDEALASWRGSVLADMDGHLRRHPVVVALGDRRLAAALSYADLALGAGRYAQAVARLRDLLPEEPLHEALQARMMLALAGAGQQAAALELFAALRERLANELGIEPGPEVRTAQLRVLRQDLPPVT
jgi:DNA-binding SARP family transcriptional activator